MIETCPTCGQTLPADPVFHGLELTEMQRRILLAVVRAGEHGIYSNALFEHLYADDPNGGPLCGQGAVTANIYYLNLKLAAVSKKISPHFRGRGHRSRYRLVSL